jgi:hypothetical protein
MDKVRAFNVRDDPQVYAERLYGCVGCPKVLGHRVGGHRRAMIVGIAGSPKCTNLQVNVLTKHPAQFGHVDPGATIDLGRKLFSHNVYSHMTQGSPSRITVLV